jgi:hypothetical protein
MPSYHVGTVVTCPYKRLNLARDFSRSVRNRHFFCCFFVLWATQCTVYCYCSPDRLRPFLKSTSYKHTGSVSSSVVFPSGLFSSGMWIPKSVLNFSWVTFHHTTLMAPGLWWMKCTVSYPGVRSPGQHFIEIIEPLYAFEEWWREW